MAWFFTSAVTLYIKFVQLIPCSASYLSSFSQADITRKGTPTLVSRDCKSGNKIVQLVLQHC